MTEEVKFNVLVSLFNWIQKSKTWVQKRSKFRKFLDTYCKPRDYFAALRLILPSLDRERGSYGLKESVLATCLIAALDMSRDSSDAVRLINWRKGGAAKTGANAGNFALVAAEILQLRQGMASAGLTIKELNDLLDRLASSENRSEKTYALSTMIQKTNAQEMKWIIMIILKDLKLGMSEKSIFHEFHPDAEDLFNVTCDLKLVCEKLRDRSQRHKRQDIEVGKAVRPQLAMRVADATAAWKKLHGKEVVVECKFDGDRIQTHKNGTDVHYFSRNFIDHSEYAHAISDLIVQNILVDKCILDGEMLVWDTALNRFADFGSNQEIAKLAREGLDSHKQICYVAFDVLYVGDTSVIHQSLKERHELLRKVVKPLKGRLEILLPNGGLNTHRPSGEPLWSFIAHSVDDIEKFFKDTVENRDEGIVLKDLGSKWEPGDRSGKWLKLKPDYVRAGSDLDVLIIGGYYGSGRRGGEVAQFLVGLAERPELNAYPRRFISFCRVGTGLSDEELDGVVSKLKPHFRKYEYPKKTPPSFYQVTNHSKERPDVWIESPEKSIILSITSDIRTIRSEVFAAPYSLRFPRIDKVRHDKPWHECLDVQSFIELVHSSNGTTQKQKESESTQDKPESKKSSKREKRNNMPVVPSQFIQTDVSDVKGKTMIFSKLMFHFVNVPPSYSREALHKMVAENGGKFSMNLNNSVTHCIAAESSGIKYQAAKLHRDIIHYSWILDCCSQKKLLPLQPKCFLHLSEASKRKLQDEMDEFSDSYYWDLDLEGIKQFLANVPESDDSQKVKYYKKKYCAEQKWSCFHGCSIYFYLYSGSIESKELLGLISKRLGLEVLMAGGKLCNDLSHATHVIVLASPDDLVDFDSLTKSVGDAQKRFLSRKRLNIVGLSWLEDSLEKGLKLSEDPYNLRPIGVEEDDSDHDMEEVNTSVAQRNASPSFGTRKGKQKKEDPEDSSDIPAASKKRGDKTQGGRRGGRTAKRGRSSATQTSRTVRTRRGKMPSKLAADETDGSDDASIEDSVPKEMDVVETITRNAETESSVAESQETLKQGGFRVSRDIRRGKSIDEAPKFEKSLDLYETGGKAESGIVQESKDRREITGDPVQAMLMNMIPSLGIKQGEGSNPVKEDKHVSTVSEAGLGEKRRLDRTEIGKPDNTDDPGVAPVKKKKVSYKDIAGELLKDW